MRFSGDRLSHGKLCASQFQTHCSSFTIAFGKCTSRALWVYQGISNMAHFLAAQRGNLAEFNCKNTFISIVKMQELCGLSSSRISNWNEEFFIYFNKKAFLNNTVVFSWGSPLVFSWPLTARAVTRHLMRWGNEYAYLVLFQLLWGSWNKECLLLMLYCKNGWEIKGQIKPPKSNLIPSLFRLSILKW